MRKLYSELLHSKMSENKNIILITADLGYGLWDKIRIDYPDRFYNVKASEQLMIGMAVGMAQEGKIPIVYSITPFVLYRPFEWIRNYINEEKTPIILVGGGRDKDYGNLGFSHWATDDEKIIKSFENIKIWKPKGEDELKSKFNESVRKLPIYINLKR